LAESTLSRRISEFLGVALFGIALIWLIALVTYEPTDPVWFFTTEAAHPPANFVGRVGAFLAELSFQLLGYASYLFPAVVGVIGWHYFWCERFDAAYTKLSGVVLLFGCFSAFLSIAFGSTEVAGKTFHAGGSIGTWLGSWLADYLNRTGSVIVILTLMALAIILSTQFSIGRLFATATRSSRDLSARGVGVFRGWLDDRRRDKQRREVIAKHTKKAGEGAAAPANASKTAEPREGEAAAAPPRPVRAAAEREGPQPVASRPAPPVVKRKTDATPSLPLGEAEPLKAPATRKLGSYTLPPPSPTSAS
jgi:DNA segregation ATPase FtsK/SpoIIIE, S-DNA-T family